MIKMEEVGILTMKISDFHYFINLENAMKKFISLFVVAGLVACGSPCEKAADATTACLDEAGIEYEETSSCEEDDGSNDELFECVSEAYTAADCSTEEGALAATLVAATCAGTELFDTAASE